MGKFKINSQIQPFDFEISCSKYQKSEMLCSKKFHFAMRVTVSEVFALKTFDHTIFSLLALKE